MFFFRIMDLTLGWNWSSRSTRFRRFRFWFRSNHWTARS